MMWLTDERRTRRASCCGQLLTRTRSRREWAEDHRQQGVLAVGRWRAVGEATEVILHDEGKVRVVLQHVEEDGTASTTLLTEIGLGGGAASSQRHSGELLQGARILPDPLEWQSKR
jgi:hypothetical protein